ncbi:MAG TPA: UbiA prenyltransferase family protein [Rhodanobacteraceae bacterium]|nr:UbiA prenyltransferase family protein [Rhodanobacteraceae bacterium]
MRALFQLARPEQWIKNGFVLLPLIFAQAAGDLPALRGAFFATVAFCLLSSAVYAGNDIVDVERDRRHPIKRDRPIASGAVKPATALAFAVALCVLGLALGAVAGGIALVATLAGYLLLQAAYSLALKHVAYLGAFVIAMGFVLRIVAGGIGADVPLTPWIVALGFLLALMLALGKRHGDFVNALAEGAGLRYDRTTLERILIAIAAATFTAYVLYTLSPSVLARHGHHPLVFSTPWVALGVGRYLKLALRDGAGSDPSALAVSDPILLLSVSGWLVTLGLILYR